MARKPDPMRDMKAAVVSVVAEARANAEAAIETARGVAESTRLRGEALRANPEIIEQIYAQRSGGWCPPTATTCIVGASALGMRVE